MFLQVSVHMGVSTPLHAGIHTPGQTHPPGQTPPGETLPKMATAADGMHPTGMHSCL